MNKIFLSLTLTALSVIAPASAATLIFDNSAAHPGGMLTFGTAVNPGPAVLSSGVIDMVTEIDGAITSLPVTGGCGPGGVYGCINFTTGAFLNQTTVGSTTIYQYNGGGSLSITGTADGAAGVLYSTPGFDGVVTLNVNNSTHLASLSATLGPGSLHPVLAAALGLSPNAPGGTDANSAIQITISSGIGSGRATTNSVQLETASPVPEPGSMMLMSAGLLGLGVTLRRRAQTIS